MWSRTSDPAPEAPAPDVSGDVSSPRRRSLEVGALAAGVVYAAGALASLAGPPPGPVAIVCAVLAAALVLIAVLRARAGITAGYAAACAVAGAAWLGFAAVTTAWALLDIAALVLPAAVLIWLYPVIRAQQDRLAAEAREAQEAAAAAKAQRKWPDLIGRIGYAGVRFAGQEETSHGYKVHLRLPGSGKVTYSGLAPATERLEVAARLRHGSLRFERGDQAHKVILHVTERDVLAETVPFPAEQGTLSIAGPIPVGLYEDGQVCAVTLREMATLIAGLRGSGKALALDTPVPTPNGWTTMGDIQAGDVVYDEKGQPCQVTDAWDIRYDRPCYQVEFSDGSMIVADGEHQWLVDTDASRRSARAKAKRESRPGQAEDAQRSHGQEYRRKLPEVVTTEAMIGSLRMPRRSNATPDGAVSNYSIRVAAPLQGADAELPVPPYTLGAWLGDGWSATGAITTADAEILTEIEAEGESIWIMPSTIKGATPRQRARRECLLVKTSPCSPSGHVVARGLCGTHWAAERRHGNLHLWPTRERDTLTRATVAGYRVGGLKVRLREIGVLGDKHIPAFYLRSSEPQRRALLAGLLDTDGHCTKQGSVEFCSTSQRLAHDVHHLVATLGYKASLRSKTARLKGRDCGTVWTVAFTTADKVFRLPRKAARQVTSIRATSCHRYITAIRPVPSVPVRCIAVDSPSHLYLVGESCIPTHNSNLLHVLLAQLARCPDVLIFAIDLKGGRMAAPWVDPWLAGWTPRPVVDWLATDREEAERMLRALQRAVQARSRSGSGGEKISPSPWQPAILLVCDEIAVILGMGMGGPRSSAEGVTNATLAGLATQLVMTGRSEAIDLIMATQRGTVTMTGSADLKSQCALRIGLGVASEADARLIIPDDVQIAADLARLRHPGTGIVQQGKYGRVLPVKFYRIEHDAISEIAQRYGEVRPRPDSLLEEALGEDYATRWTRGRPGRIPAPRQGLPAGVAGHATHGLLAGPEPAGLTAAGRAEAGQAELETAARAAIEPAGQAQAAGSALPARPAQPARPGAAGVDDAGHPSRRRMLALLRSAGVKGMTVPGIADQLALDGREIAHQTVHRWLAEEAAAGRVVNASYGRWKWRAD
jgi:hypothetical protein